MIFPRLFGKHIVYADHASTTPVSPAVLTAMKPYWSNNFHNPSALYQEGKKAKEAIEQSRKDVAKVIHVQPGTITFTSGGTESVHIALVGTFEYAKAKGISHPHIVTTSFEHPAVIETCIYLESKGARLTYVDPGEDGKVRINDVINAIRDDTVLISVMYVNNELGTIQPVRQIGKRVQEMRKGNQHIFPYFHTDACQAVNFISLDPQTAGVDMLTLDAGKVYGPKGVGILYKHSQVELAKVLYGGDQEHGIRPGTEPVPQIVGFAAAMKETDSVRKSEALRLEVIKNKFLHKLSRMPFAWSRNGDTDDTIPNTVNICIQDIQAEYAVILLGEHGVLASSGTACSQLADKPFSQSVESIGKRDCTRSSLRFTFGRSTTSKDIDRICDVLPRVVSLSQSSHGKSQ